MASISTLVDDEVNDECIEGRYYDTSLGLCMPCKSLCFELNSTVIVDQKCCTVLETCAGGFPQFALGCAQSLESTSKALQVTDSAIDLQREAVVSRTFLISTLIFFVGLLLLAIFFVIVFRRNKKNIHYSKELRSDETEERQTLSAVPFSTSCQSSSTTSRSCASDVKQSESNRNPTASPRIHQTSVVKSFESQCYLDVRNPTTSFESINDAMISPAFHRTHNMGNPGNTYAVPANQVVAQRERTVSSESNCNIIADHVVDQGGFMESFESKCDTIVDQVNPHIKFIDSFQSNQDVHNSYFITQSHARESSKNNSKITEIRDTTQFNVMQSFKSDRDAATRHAVTQNDYIRTSESNSDAVANQVAMQSHPMRSFVSSHNPIVENSENNYIATSDFVSNNNILEKTTNLDSNYNALNSSTCIHNDCEKTADVLERNTTTRLFSNKRNPENSIKCSDHVFVRHDSTKHFETSHSAVTDRVFTENTFSFRPRATVRDVSSLNCDLDGLNDSYHAFTKPALTNQQVLLKELNTIVLQNCIAVDIDDILSTDWATYTSCSVNTSNSGIGNKSGSITTLLSDSKVSEWHDSGCLKSLSSSERGTQLESAAHCVSASNIPLDVDSSASPDNYQHILELPDPAFMKLSLNVKGSIPEANLSSVVTSCPQSVIDSLQPSFCEFIPNSDSNISVQSAEKAFQLNNVCIVSPALKLSLKLPANEQCANSIARTAYSQRFNKSAEQLERTPSSLSSNQSPSLQSPKSLMIKQSTSQVSCILRRSVSAETLTSLDFSNELSDVQSTKSLARTTSSLQLYRKSLWSLWLQSAQSLENNSIDLITLLKNAGSTKSSKNYVEHSRSLESLNKNVLPTGSFRTETGTNASCWSFGDDALTGDLLIRYSITSGSTRSASSEKILVNEEIEKRLSKSTDTIPMQLDPRRLKEELYRKQVVPCQPSSTSTTPMTTLTTKTEPALDAPAKFQNKINKQNSPVKQSNSLPQQKTFRLQVRPRNCKRPSEYTCRKVDDFNERLRSSRRKGDTTLALLVSEVSINKSSTKSVTAELIRGLSQENLPRHNLQSALQQLLKLARRKCCVRLLEDFFRQTTLAVDLLTAACVSGLTRTVTRLTADFKIDINEQDVQGWSPLTATCADGSLAMVKWLINETEADTTITNTDLQTPLIVACDKYRPNIIRLLLSDENAQYLENDVNMADVTERTALHYVVEHNTNYGRTYLHELCLRSDVTGVRNVVYSMYPREVNAQDNDGWTPLHLACMTGNVDIAKMLLWCGAEIDARDDDWDTPGDLAEAAGNGYMVDMLKLKPEIDWQPSYFPFYQDIIDPVVVYNYYY